MDDTPSTQKSLLLRLRQKQDKEAWQHFVDLYAPIVYRYARRHHLQDADAADLTQEVLQNVSTAIDQLDYDPKRGSFRGWLFTLARRRLIDYLNRCNKQERGSGGSDAHAALQEASAPHEDVWEQEYQRQLFVWLKDELQHQYTPTTWQAFWQTAVEGKPISEVAEKLQLTLSAVYIARSRVQSRIRDKINQVNED